MAKEKKERDCSAGPLNHDQKHKLLREIKATEELVAIAGVWMMSLPTVGC